MPSLRAADEVGLILMSLLTVKQVAEDLNVSIGTVYNWCATARSVGNWIMVVPQHHPAHRAEYLRHPQRDCHGQS
jgi:transposase